ncbi:SGNH/GDSL hydrolase family protein [Microbacterium sp. CFBP9034]|uniref:SGNH/GDSL hydrolase family protein n=1 Tax=Microbacterium sp. CFBP9034 TaxID=3096540 RepID=UPI002A6AB9E5|nr:SGNH/GDSL hydrolase family protein [Microbacterium sp. CFBP9034]MDY0907962.1 SGNH/GDSL hydrolase family protein [Microbacterium sp. CFBP9034]
MKRRAIALAAILALGLSVLSAAPAATAAEPGAVYVALGDSEAAGTGNLPYVDQSCLRSKKAYPVLLSAMLGTGGVASSACAGATTQDVSGQLGDLGSATQLVTITAGVNDLAWQQALQDCSSAGTAADCAEALQAAALALGQLPTRIGTMIGTVRTLAPNAMIIVTGYPMLFGEVTSRCSVGAYQGTPVKFTAQQAAAVNFALTQVNAAIMAGVEGYKALTGDPAVEYVDVTAGFEGHALCDTGARWVSGLVSGKATSDRGFHANVAGQQAYAAIIAAALAS